MSQGEERYHQERARIEQGHVKYRDKLRAEGKLFVRERLKLLLDPGTELQEEWLFARSQEADTPADAAHASHHPISGRIRFLRASEEPVLLERGAGVEQELQAVADEELALLAQLVPVLDVALLDARPLGEVALFAHGRGRITAGSGWPTG